MLPDLLTWIAFAAAATTRLRFMTGPLILPLRNPVVLAEELTTLDAMSGGRIDLGIGVGWLKEEFDAVGVPFARRGKRTDAYIGAMRALWAKDDASFQSDFVAFEGINCNPKRAQGAVPIIVGGHSEAAARRAAIFGDGFFPATGSPVGIESLIAFMRRTAPENGRDPNGTEITTGCQGALPGSGMDPLAAVAEAAARGAGRVVLPGTAFMTGAAPTGGAQHARSFAWLAHDGLEERLMAFGERVVRQVKG